MKKLSLQAFITGAVAIMFICGAATTNAATWTVTKSTNSNDGVCSAQDCSLREAVFKADSGDTVNFSSNLIGQTITLGGSEIVITKRIIIDGYLNDPNVAFISGENTSRIFFVQSGAALNLKNAILVQGSGESSPGNSGTNIGAAGGAIFTDNNSNLLLDRVAIRGNKAKFGGGVYLSSDLHQITNSSFTGNSAENGTAILMPNSSNGSLFMSNTTLSGNFISIINPDTFGGGALCVKGGIVTIRNSTIAYNSSLRGGGITFIPTASGNRMDIGNTIVAGNTSTYSGQDILFSIDLTLTSRGGNLIQNLETVPDGTFNQPKDISGVNPLLAPTNSNQGGFPVITHPLQAGSPARNGGLNQNAVDPLSNSPLTTDARGAGFPRIADGTVDIGAFEDQSGNTSLVVTKKADTNDLVCDTDCSLREAVHQAGLNFGTDTITFALNVFGTITLGGTEILIKNQTVNIVGYTKANTLSVSGNNASRIFKLENSTVSISGMTLTGGKAEGVPNSNGGALAGTDSNLTLDRVIITGNDAFAYGAFYLQDGSTQRVINSTISGNTATTCVGVGVRSTTLFVANTTISGNSISGAGAGNGALCGATGTINIRNSTIAFNRAGKGGGINLSASTLNIGNSIVAQNIAAVNPDIELQTGSITSVGGNLIGNADGFPAGTFNQTNDVVNVDPLLNALADNGGNVTTHSLMVNSPAINTGVSSVAVDPFNNSLLATDARGAGFARINGTVDKGAFEFSFAPTAASVTLAGRVQAPSGKGIGNARVYLTDQQGSTRTALTNPLGYYRFQDVAAGGTYVLNVFSKRYSFQPQVVNVTEEMNDLNFVAGQ